MHRFYELMAKYWIKPISLMGFKNQVEKSEIYIAVVRYFCSFRIDKIFGSVEATKLIVTNR